MDRIVARLAMLGVTSITVLTGGCARQLPPAHELDSADRTLLIQAADDREFEVLGVTASSPSFRAAASRGKPGKRHWVDAFFEPGDRGPYTGRLVVTTSHAESPRMEIVVEGFGEERSEKGSGSGAAGERPSAGKGQSAGG